MTENERLSSHVGSKGYEDKTYSAETVMDARGYVTKLYVTYFGDEIMKAHIVGVKVDFDLHPEYGSNKRSCVFYNRDMEDESGISWIEAASRMERDIVLNGKVSPVKGARFLSMDIKELFQEIKDKKE